jgi:hypothetical protein
MQLAVQRARQGVRSPPTSVTPDAPRPNPVDDPPTVWQEPAAPRHGPGRPAGSGHWSPPAQQERWLRGAVALTAALVVAAAISLTAVLATRQSGSGGGAPATVTTTAPNGTTAHHGARSRSAATTTTTPVVVAPGSPPQISSLSPSSGGAGQSVVIAGGGLMSSNGVISVTFNGQTAHIDCPQQTSCTVTVPTLSTPGPVTVVVTTSAGPSNGLKFTYQ